jgi:HNH endonuclease/Helix-turn-helix domain of resolvase
MTRAQQNKRAQEMYDLYLQGYSLEQVGKAYNITRQSVYQIFARRDFAMRQIQPLPYFVFGDNKYTLNTNNYYRRTDGDRELLHRDVWKSVHGDIPMGYDIHHKDEDKSNNDIENLELLPTAEHTQLHNPLRDTPIKFCLTCGEQIVRKVRPSGILETPSALGKRYFCDTRCAGKYKIGKPRGGKV